MVVARFPESDQYGRAYSIYLRLGIGNAYSRRSSDGSASPVTDRILSVCSPEPIPFCGEEIDEIPDRDLSMPGSHGRILKGFVSGDSRARTSPRGSKYSDRNWSG
jgi:hypothetical protein